jgi:membrane fusion protein, multidrug efflux system
MAVIAVVCLALAGCKDKQSQAAVPPPKPSVNVVTLRAQPVKLITELPGRTSPYRTAEVRPQVNGIILKRLFTGGDTVQAGLRSRPPKSTWPTPRCCRRSPGAPAVPR